jgi:hypothetical protein
MNLTTSSSSRPAVGVVGAGRLGVPLCRALKAAGWSVDGPAGRGEGPHGEAILLCVPDAEIPAAAEVVTGAAPFVAHTSGATGLDACGRQGAGLSPPRATGPVSARSGPSAAQFSTVRATRGASRALARGGESPAPAATVSAAASMVTRKFEATEAAAW